MKPHLKLLLNGRISIVRKGELGWSELEAKSFVRRQYGSIQDFADRIEISPVTVYDALKSFNHHAIKQAGKVAFVRQLLGLRSNPTERCLRVANALAKRRSHAGDGV